MVDMDTDKDMVNIDMDMVDKVDMDKDMVDIDMEMVNMVDIDTDKDMVSYFYSPIISILRIFIKILQKQVGAELCQAQFKLGINKPALPGVTKNMDVFLLPKN